MDIPHGSVVCSRDGCSGGTVATLVASRFHEVPGILLRWMGKIQQPNGLSRSRECYRSYSDDGAPCHNGLGVLWDDSRLVVGMLISMLFDPMHPGHRHDGPATSHCGEVHLP